MNVGLLYHWSPSIRREGILREGLKVYSEPVTHTGDERYPYLCFGPTPSAAWGLSGDMEWTSEHEQWDLWQVRLVEGDEVHVRAEFGPTIYEVRVRNSIPADRVWYVGTREPAFAK
jgi:hypothetical protein